MREDGVGSIMKKLDGFDYKKAEADLDDIGVRHPDEIYSYHSEKAVRGYMKEHGLNLDKYYKSDRKNSKSSSNENNDWAVSSLLHVLLHGDCQTPVLNLKRCAPFVMACWPICPVDRVKSKNTTGWLLALWLLSISGRTLRKSGTAYMMN